MARSYLLVPVALLFTGAPFARSAEPAERAPVDVTVSATCTGNAVTVSISPWEARITRDDSVTWSLGGAADSVDIQPLNRGGRAWPFQRNNPGRARRSQRASSGRTRGNVQAGTYAYQIILYCGGRRIVIDPEVIIEDELP